MSRPSASCQGALQKGVKGMKVGMWRGVHDRIASGIAWAAAGALTTLVLTAGSGCKRPADDGRDTARTQGTAESAPAAPAAPATPTPAEPAAPAQQQASATAPAAAGDLGPVSTALSAPPPELAGQVTLVRVAKGLKRPVGLEYAPGDTSGRLFVLEQHAGLIRILRPGTGGEYAIERKPFLDLEGNVSRGNEQGLLGLAFHPKFAENGRFYINHTDRAGDTHVLEYRVDPTKLDQDTPRMTREILKLDQPYSNHNGGNLEFGLDGKLYVGTGDGGSAGDPLRAGQDPNQLLAKMLRFDVDTRLPEPEIVQLGLRNPWRYHFDARTGDLYIADVGQNQYEFVHVVAGDDIDGHNFGWNVVEGNHCYGRKTCDRSKFTAPAVEYDHSVGCSITGGMVYRGKAIPALDGVYFYADFCTGIIRSFRWTKEGVHQHWIWDSILNPRQKVDQISTFGTDPDGEMYVVSLSGSIYKLVPR